LQSSQLHASAIQGEEIIWMTTENNQEDQNTPLPPQVLSDAEVDVHRLCNEFFLDLVTHNHFLGISGSSLATVGTCQLPLADSCSYISQKIIHLS